MIIPNANKITLDNGLKIVTEEIPSMRSVTMGILVGAGSGNETDKESGLTHFIEHMSFKGTQKRSAFAIAHDLDSIGGKINAYTGKEYTVYYSVVLDKHIDTAIDVLSDILLNSKFDPKEIEVEKQVVLEEINMYEDSPDEQIHDLFIEKILHGHPLGLPTIGTKKSVSAIDKKEISNFEDKWYTPGNTIISLAGAIPKDLINRLKPYFESWTKPTIKLTTEQPNISGSINLKTKKTEQVHLCLGTKGVAQTDDDRYPYALLDNILGGSMSSRLFQEIREKRGLAYSVYSSSLPFRNCGLAYVYAGTKEKNLEQVIDLVLKELSRLKKEPISADDLNKAKEYLKGSLVLGLESTSARMSWLAKAEFYHQRAITIDEIFAKVDKVNQDDIIRLANQFFEDKYLTLAVIGHLKRLPFKDITI